MSTMRCLGLVAAVFAATFSATSALPLVDASSRTTVTVAANGFDSGSCTSNGCYPGLTRDGDTDDDSRWSCQYSIPNAVCEVCFGFASPQDIEVLSSAFYNGDQRYRTLGVTATSSTGSTTYYQFDQPSLTTDYIYHSMNTEETSSICVSCVDLENQNDWCSITELEFLVE